ncbi:MAG: AzlC family ABC transporter permease [Butyrivibrio sp.]|nr:AzlC family ABC transporter permease [Butyrivibrio sp.]
MEKSEDFKLGIQNGIPICLGYLAVSFAFGIQASEAGLTTMQAVIMSLTNVTSAGQFSSLELIAAQASFAELALLQFIINLRYMLMSTALTQKLKPEVPTYHRMGIAYGVTDEIFGVSILKGGELRPAFSYGLIVISVFGWVMGTLLGAVAGQIMPQRLISALGLAIYGMFLAIIIPEAKVKKPVMIVVISAMLLSTVFTYTPILNSISSGFRIIIVTVVIAAAAAFFAPVKDSDEGSKEVDANA